MAQISVAESAALSRIAGHLVNGLTNSVISRVADAVGLPAAGSNKHDRISSLLVSSHSRTPLQRESLIATLVMQAYSLNLAGKTLLTVENVDAIVADIHELGLHPGELSKKGWRIG